MKSEPPILYEWLLSPSAEKIRRAFKHKKVDFVSEEVFFFDRSKLIEVSGQRRVPIMKHNGNVLGPRTFDMMAYIDKAFPGEDLFPGNSLLLCRNVDLYVEQELLPLAVRALMPWALPLLTYTEDRKKLVDETLKPVCNKTSDEITEEQDNNFPNLIKEITPHLEALDTHFASRDFYLGNQLSAADHSLYAIYWYMGSNPNWADKLKSLSGTHLAKWAARQADFHYTGTMVCSSDKSDKC